MTACRADLIYFLHINKNAGTTLRYILKNNYRDEAFLELMLQGRRAADGRAKTVESIDEDVYQALDEVQRRIGTLACVAANMPVGLHSVISRPVTYFTFVREPVSRCISYWYFAHRTRNEGNLWSTLERHEFDVRRICEQGAGYQFTNDQVRMISGSSEPEPGKAEFELACEVIERRFALAAAVEFFDPCLQVLARDLGWCHIPAVRLNVGLKTDPSILPPKAEAHFRELNEWDIRLYDWVTSDYLPRKLGR